MLKITTESGSIYIIDKDKKLIKRIAENESTKRITSVWKKFEEIQNLEIGKKIIIFWNKSEKPLTNKNDMHKMQYLPLTVTTKIVSIIHLN